MLSNAALEPPIKPYIGSAMCEPWLEIAITFPRPSLFSNSGIAARTRKTKASTLMFIVV